MPASRRLATLVGATAIIQWGAQVLISTYAIAFPPFQVIAMTFFVAFLVMAAKWAWRRDDVLSYARHGAEVWAIGIVGLFGYYLLFYLALKSAPAVDVALLVNLWPLLMVLFTGLLPGGELRWYHVVGCLIGVSGSIVLLDPAVASRFDASHLAGQALAIAAAFVWAAFCVATRAIGAVPTDTVGWYCLATAMLALLCHLLLERTVMAATPAGWWSILALGVGPIGIAFFAWDVGLKHGNIRLLGVLAFFIPVISSGLLIATGHGGLTSRVIAAAVLIVGGTIVASKEEIAATLPRRRRRTTGTVLGGET